MTLDGTNTWVLREPGATECVVIDPGPLHEAHLHAVLDVVRRDGGRVERFRQKYGTVQRLG